MDSVCNKNPKLLVYVEPTDLNIEDAQSKLKVRLWNQTVDRYGLQITCRVCELKGHYQSHCPVANSSGNCFGSGSSNNTSTDTATAGSCT